MDGSARLTRGQCLPDNRGIVGDDAIHAQGQQLPGKRFIEYVTVLENIVTDAMVVEKTPAEEPKLSKGWSPA